jgi:hypothetical protein
VIQVSSPSRRAISDGVGTNQARGTSMGLGLPLENEPQTNYATRLRSGNGLKRTVAAGRYWTNDSPKTHVAERSLLYYSAPATELQSQPKPSIAAGFTRSYWVYLP